MRVLLVTDWSSERGGTENHVRWLRDGLLAAGDEARLLTTSTGTAGDGAADYIALGSENLAAQTFLQIVNPFAAATARRAVREFRPDVAWVNTFAKHLSPAVLESFGSTPVVQMISDYKVICPIGTKLLPNDALCSRPAGWICCRSGCVSLPHWLRDQPRYALIRRARRKAAKVLTCSRWMRRCLLEHGIESHVVSVPVLAPSRDFARRPSREPTFLYCGRLSKEKGVALLFRAFGRLLRNGFRSAQLRIAGDGAEAAELKSLAADLGLSDAVSFLGWQRPDGVERELSAAWACVAPSLWAEPQGLIAVEAIVRGAPVIASETGGFGETVRHGVTGLLFPNGDGDALAKALHDLAAGAFFPDHTLGAEPVRETAEKFSLDRHVQLMREIFADAAGSKGKGRR